MNEKLVKAKEDTKPASQCALCLDLRKLSYSHIIPNAYFRAMKRSSNGKLIEMDTNPRTSVRLSQDSLADHLLCSDCERRIGKWETPWIWRLRQTAKHFTKDADDVPVLKYEYATLRCFLLSIIWRAAVCSRVEFSDVKFSARVLESLRADLYAGRAPDEGVMGVRIRKLVDPDEHLIHGALEHFASSPIKLSSGGLEGYQLFFGGYVVDFITSKITRRVSRMRGFVRDESSLAIPAAPFLQERNFMMLGLHIMDKHALGQTAFADKA